MFMMRARGLWWWGFWGLLMIDYLLYKYMYPTLAEGYGTWFARVTCLLTTFGVPPHILVIPCILPCIRWFPYHGQRRFISMSECRRSFPTITGTFLEGDVKPYHPRSTHSIISRLTFLVSISFFRAVEPLDLVMESAGLLHPWIHLISVISCLSYVWRRLMISIIRRFSWVVPNLIKQSYRDFESVQSINGMSAWRMFINVALITTYHGSRLVQ